MDIASTGFHAHAADDGDADIAHALVLAIRQGEHRGHGDRIAGVHTDRINVFNRADHHDVVLGVAHELELVFLPALDALLDQDLIGR